MLRGAHQDGGPSGHDKQIEGRGLARSTGRGRQTRPNGKCSTMLPRAARRGGQGTRPQGLGVRRGRGAGAPQDHREMAREGPGRGTPGSPSDGPGPRSRGGRRRRLARACAPRSGTWRTEAGQPGFGGRVDHRTKRGRGGWVAVSRRGLEVAGASAARNRGTGAVTQPVRAENRGRRTWR